MARILTIKLPDIGKSVAVVFNDAVTTKVELYIHEQDKTHAYYDQSHMLTPDHQVSLDNIVLANLVIGLEAAIKQLQQAQGG